MTSFARKAEITERSQEDIDLRLKDDRSRAIGQRLMKWTQQKEVPETPTLAERLADIHFFPDGLRYGYALQGTRDGKVFGSHQAVWFQSAEERDEAARAALASSRSYYLRTYRYQNQQDGNTLRKETGQ